MHPGHVQWQVYFSCYRMEPGGVIWTDMMASSGGIVKWVLCIYSCRPYAFRKLACHRSRRCSVEAVAPAGGGTGFCGSTDEFDWVDLGRASKSG